MNVKKNLYVLDGLCSWAVVELAENPTIGTDMSCVSWHTFPFPPPEFLTNCCPAKEILLDGVKELLLGAGGGSVLFQLVSAAKHFYPSMCACNMHKY